MSSETRQDWLTDSISGFKTLEQSSGSQRPKFRQELTTFGARERKMTILLGPGTQFRPTLTTE